MVVDLLLLVVFMIEVEEDWRITRGSRA